jgi:hypothetical protein
LQILSFYFVRSNQIAISGVYIIERERFFEIRALTLPYFNYLIVYHILIKMSGRPNPWGTTGDTKRPACFIFIYPECGSGFHPAIEIIIISIKKEIGAYPVLSQH